MTHQKSALLPILFAAIVFVSVTVVPACGQKKANAAAPSLRTATDDLLLSTMQKELHRGQTELAKQDPAPYFSSYNVTDGDSLVVLSAQGAILSSTRTRTRTADVSMRIGAPALDNTHDQERASGITSGQLPLRDDADAIARVLWRLTYDEYRKARQSFATVKTKSAVRAKDEDDSRTFQTKNPRLTASKHPCPRSLNKKPGKVWHVATRRHSANTRKSKSQSYFCWRQIVTVIWFRPRAQRL